MSNKTWTLNQLKEAVISSISYAEVVSVLGLSRKAAGNWKTVKEAIADNDLDASHFTHRPRVHSGGPSTRPLSDILVAGGKRYGTSNLRKRLLSEGLKAYLCEECGLSEWRGQPIALELDHISGDNVDNRLENLKMLCPNCHAQTPTWRGRNIKRKSVPTQEELARVVCACGSKKDKIALRCQACKNSEDLARITADCSPEELKKLVWEHPTTKVAEMLGVSDVAVAKRCKKFGIDKPPRGYWAKVR